MRISNLLFVSALLILAGCSSTAVYGPRSTSTAPPVRTAPTLAPAATSAAWITLSAAQTAAVRAYYQPQQGKSHGRGAGGLPPGIAKNLARGKPLPPGIAKQYLPQELLVRLPRLDDGLSYVVAAGKLLLVEATTQVVRQVLIDALYT